MSTNFTGNANAPIPEAAFVQPLIVGDKWGRISSATTTQLKTGPGFMAGIIVASTTSGTILVYDDVASTQIAINTMTPNLGWNPLPLPFLSGLRITTANTIDCTVVFI